MKNTQNSSSSCLHAACLQIDTLPVCRGPLQGKKLTVNKKYLPHKSKPYMINPDTSHYAPLIRALSDRVTNGERTFFFLLCRTPRFEGLQNDSSGSELFRHFAGCLKSNHRT
jgi:hypothetical protein